jgi:anti-anti-sigma factor
MQSLPEQLSRRAECHDAQRLHVMSRRDGPVHSISLAGELDLATAEAVQSALERAERGDARSIVLDLSRVTFMDSTGVRIVLNAEARSRLATHRLSVRRGRATVQRVFEICGVDALLPFVD